MTEIIIGNCNLCNDITVLKSARISTKGKQIVGCNFCEKCKSVTVKEAYKTVTANLLL